MKIILSLLKTISFIDHHAYNLAWVGKEQPPNNYITILIILVILLACSIGMTIEIHITSDARECITYF